MLEGASGEAPFIGGHIAASGSCGCIPAIPSTLRQRGCCLGPINSQWRNKFGRKHSFVRRTRANRKELQRGPTEAFDITCKASVRGFHTKRGIVLLKRDTTGSENKLIDI